MSQFFPSGSQSIGVSASALSFQFTVKQIAAPRTPRWASQVVPVVKNPPINARDRGDEGSVPGSGRSLEKDITTHSSILAWRIPWTEELGRLQSMGLQRVRPKRIDLACMHTHMRFCSLRGARHTMRPQSSAALLLMIIIIIIIMLIGGYLQSRP